MATELSNAPATQDTPYVEFWNDILVPKFVRFKHILVGGLTHHSDKVFPSLKVKEGDRVVDVGCGFGDTAMLLAKLVGPRGYVLGLDCCEGFLEFGRQDSASAGLKNIDFADADVQTYPFKHDFDFCFSRFGTQFFENPVAALRNMRTSLRPGGKMTMIVWRTSDDNPWLAMAKNIVLRHLPPPGDDARTCGPGPFSMANQEMVTRQLQIAGYTDIEFERIDVPVLVGDTPDDAVAFQLALGPAGEVYREAGDLARNHHDEIAADLRATLARYQTSEGIVMDSSSWKVTARNPG